MFEKINSIVLDRFVSSKSKDDELQLRARSNRKKSAGSHPFFCFSKILVLGCFFQSSYNFVLNLF